MQSTLKVLSLITQCLFSRGSANGQPIGVINGDIYYAEVRLLDTYGPVGLDANNSVVEQVSVVNLANDKDGIATSLFDNTSDFINTHDLSYYIFTDHAGWHSELSGGVGTDSLIKTLEGNTSGYVDFEVAVWENDTSPLCEYNRPGGDNDDRFDSLTDRFRLAIDSKFGNTRDMLLTYQIPTSDAQVMLRDFGRFASGVKQDSLDFDVLEDNSEYHNEDTTTRDSNQTSTSSYTNLWTVAYNVTFDSSDFTDAPVINSTDCY